MAKLLMNGKFSLYETPEGGLHVAYVPDGDQDDEPKHLEIPAMVVKMAKASAEGKLSPLAMMRQMMGAGE
jgi:hypothetical protein